MSSACPFALSVLPSACIRVLPVALPTASLTEPLTLFIVPAIWRSYVGLCPSQPNAATQRSAQFGDTPVSGACHGLCKRLRCARRCLRRGARLDRDSSRQGPAWLVSRETLARSDSSRAVGGALWVGKPTYVVARRWSPVRPSRFQRRRAAGSIRSRSSRRAMPRPLLLPEAKLSQPDHGSRSDADARNSARRGAYPPVRVSRRVRVPKHDLVEIDRLRFRTPVTVDAEARLCVDERRAVAADAVVTICHGSLVAAAE